MLLYVDDYLICAILYKSLGHSTNDEHKKTSKKVLKKCLTEWAELDRIIKSPVDETLQKKIVETGTDLWKLNNDR